MGTEVARPAHTDGGADSNGVAVDPALGSEVGNQAQCSAHSTKSGDGEGDLVRIVQAEQRFQDEVDLVGQGRQQLDTLVGCARESAVLACTKREDHDQRGDDQHTRDDGHSYLHTRFATVEQRVERAQEGRFLLLVDHLLRHFLELLGVESVLLAVGRIGFQHEILHAAGGDDAARAGAEETDERLHHVALSHHEDDHDEAHTEGRTEVGQGDVLELLEVATEVGVLCQRDDGGVVAEEGQDGAQRGHTRKVENRLHERAQDLLDEVHYAKLHKHLTQRAREHTDGHEVEASVEQKVVCGVHHGVEHGGSTHSVSDVTEERTNDE